MMRFENKWDEHRISFDARVNPKVRIENFVKTPYIDRL